MDPESYSLSGLQERKNTEQELQMYDLFPMYPTCKSPQQAGHPLWFDGHFTERGKSL